MTHELWIADADTHSSSTGPALVFQRLEQDVKMLSEGKLREAVSRKLKDPSDAPVLILLDAGLPQELGYAVLQWRSELPWYGPKRSPMIVCVTPGRAYEAARKQWLPILRTRPDDYHFYTQDELSETEMAAFILNKAQARRLHAEYGMLIGQDKALQQVKRYIDLFAAKKTPILILGESGTGKDLVARALHWKSRRTGPFLQVNCAQASGDRVDTELFGHERGAFTGAYEQHIGLLQEADRGTLFLDEVGETPATTQAKLLIFLQNSVFRRLNRTRDIQVDVRVIAATNRDLQEAIREKQFRPDFYQRLCGFVLTLPPLRERKEDLPALIDYFLQEAAMQYERYKQFDQKSMELLMNRPWEGNIRELQQVVDTAHVLSDQDHTIRLEHLQEALQARNPSAVTNHRGSVELSTEKPAPRLNPSHKTILTRDDVDVLKQALKEGQGVPGRAAQALKNAGYRKGASRGQLRAWLGDPTYTTRANADQETIPALQAWYMQEFPDLPLTRNLKQGQKAEGNASELTDLK